MLAMARINVTTLLSNSLPSNGGAARYLHASSPAFAFFRRKKVQEEPEESAATGTFRPELQADVLKSGFLGQYEKAALNSVIDKGLGKTILPYEPPEDVERRISGIFSETFGQPLTAEIASASFPNRLSKFKFLTACEEMFSHAIPSPQLHDITSVDKAAEFYRTPVTGLNGLTQFQRRTDLPPNMHVSYNPIRFDPDNDPYYGGVTAFPGRSSVIVGLKAKKMYKGFQFQADWPKYMDTYKVYRHMHKHPWRNDHKFERIWR
ncbi:uncharacterized protein LOC129590693 [Paramacrobiotus metropolitanus]|uniref:uncharacterized protein LOC129590693 n=1 Tax=Paramacrobiotus metropolitanus TaxID=2943436 RepID=UPI002445EAB3|nr:uncharacterized protein LOC129590693 [Paramacrobiotus metropolitanus]